MLASCGSVVVCSAGAALDAEAWPFVLFELALGILVRFLFAVTVKLSAENLTADNQCLGYQFRLFVRSSTA